MGMSAGSGAVATCLLSSAPEVRDQRPVRAVARAGAQRALVQKALRKRTPSRPMRSWFGVWRMGWPAMLRASARWPSV